MWSSRSCINDQGSGLTAERQFSPAGDTGHRAAQRRLADPENPWSPIRVRGTSSPAMRDNIRLVSSAGTGFTYYTTKNKRKQQGKLELNKYDPVVRKHVVFKEAKMPPHSK